MSRGNLLNPCNAKGLTIPLRYYKLQKIKNQYFGGNLPMEEDDIFVKRIIECKLFTEEEIKVIMNDKILYERCYLLGVLDGQ